ncbi:MAG: glycosyltransferase family 1 protein [Gemmatimonadota bacterium]
MKVLLDVSNLGLAHGSAETRTGIFRATEFLVDELLRRNDLDLGFAALESYVAEVQLARYDRSVAGQLGARMVSAWDAPGTDLGASVRLVDSLESVNRDAPEGKRIVAELALTNRLARPRALPGAFEIVHSLKHPLRSRDRVPGALRIVTIHDMVPVLFPELAEERFVVEHQAMTRSLEPGSDWIICNSECTKADACRILGFPNDRAFVTPFAADPRVFRPSSDGPERTAILARYGLAGRDYLLSLCTLEPRKNLPALLRAFFAIAGEPGNDGLLLALVGPTGWKSQPLFELIGERPDLRERIVLTGYVPDAELSAIYSGARAFAYPSLYEGFGLPPLEAMCCGTAVVTSTAGSIPEVVGSAAILVEPRDEAGLAAALRKVLADDRLATEMSVKGLERAKEFSWARTAQGTVAAYRAMLASS